METLKGLAEEYAQRDDLYTENGEYTKTTVINAFNDGAKAMLQVIGFSLAAHRHKEIKVTTKKERKWLIEQINKTNMEVKELRIGNIVKIDDEYLGPIEGRVTSLNEKAEVELLLSVNKGNLRYFVCGSDDIFPIPITDELLLKIGFKKKRDGYLHYIDHNDEFSIKFDLGYAFIGYANIYFNPEDVIETNYSSSLVFPNTLHLHTLQNIWHLLTGKELEIKL